MFPAVGVLENVHREILLLGHVPIHPKNDVYCGCVTIETQPPGDSQQNAALREFPFSPLDSITIRGDQKH